MTNPTEKPMPSRRNFIKYLAGTAAATSCGLESVASHASAPESAGQRPNLVCFLGEGLRPDEFSLEGNKLLHTPNMDRIGREGCVFENSFVTNALCLPSRATMLTGMYSHSTGATTNVQGRIAQNIPLVSDLPTKGRLRDRLCW